MQQYFISFTIDDDPDDDYIYIILLYINITNFQRGWKVLRQKIQSWGNKEIFKFIFKVQFWMSAAPEENTNCKKILKDCGFKLHG